jgi:hypothetical protein
LLAFVRFRSFKPRGARRPFLNLRFAVSIQLRVVPRLISTHAALDPVGPADDELDWFFTEAEPDVGVRSNYMDSLVPAQHRADTEEARFVAARRYRVVLERLRTIGDPDAGVLEAAYAVRPWPVSLREALGRSTGVAVRLRVAERGMPADDAELDRLERQTAERLNEMVEDFGPAALETLRAKAAAHFRRAYRAYRAERAHGETVVRGGR